MSATAGSPAPADEPDRLGPERLLAFSDGVIAIALTLLVLPLAGLIPDEAEPGFSGSSLITENLPLVGSFLLSFVVIGRFWMAHHRLFDRVRRTTGALVWLNLAWLLTVVVLPFPTEMVGVAGDDPFTLRFYVGTLLASSVLLSVMTELVARSGIADPARERQPASYTTSVLLAAVFVAVVVRPQLGYLPLLVLFAGPLVESALRRWIGAAP